jgi:hypothetical protein
LAPWLCLFKPVAILTQIWHNIILFYKTCNFF